ncbi:hypothetical protein L2E82_31095 [Cichorium intybus]|uniref:Uncharacterized protein n=1 Tax=Cichorium intybus TaxID=13427 RepID=A0ACB9D272_CICIN|nr:hypothetical protein L2E82_31095 [Cichorium intybus]
MKNLDFSSWRKELDERKSTHPLTFKTFGDAIPPQYAIQVLDELIGRNAIISTEIGQHHIAIGFSLPAAIGVTIARPEAIVVDIDGDGSFMINVQELATIKFAEACDIPAARVTKIGDLRAVIQKMLDTLALYLLDVIVPHQEHVLPIIPVGGGFRMKH